MMQTDSIQVNTAAGVGQVANSYHKLTPAQVLSWYPESYTPAQKDSVIQKHIKPGKIRWSQRPDTLHLPGHSVGRSVLDTYIPQYYKESFFSDKEYFHPEIMGGRQGVAGDPVPYTVAGDDFMTTLLLLCFIVTMYVLRGTGTFISKWLKSFLYFRSGNTSDMTETGDEVRFQLVLIAEMCLMSSILFVTYLREFVTDTFTVGQPNMIALFTSVFVGAFIVKHILYQMVNSVFFDKKKNQHWQRSFYFVSAVLGLLLLPMVLIQSYFHLSLASTVIYVLMILFLYEILLLYRQGQIFFAQKGRYLQNILYFCMLEIIPMALIWYVLAIISEDLKINF